jgi:hypothetical protein
MKRLLPLLASILTSPLFLCSCAQQRTVAFDEAAFTRYGASGSGTVTGTAFLTIAKDNTITAGDSKSEVKLMPANAYTDEIVAKHYQTNLKIAPADPRFKKYVRKTNSDGAGHFAFHHVPPGVYYVSCDLAWNAPSTSTDSNGAILATSDSMTHWIYKKISVGNGQTVRVESWDNNF